MRRLWNGASARALLVGGMILGAGCGPIEYIVYVPADAAGAIAEAKHLGADKYAPYEITAAEQYIYKARELAGYARFQSSVGFGRKAGTNARKAREISIDKAKLPEAEVLPPPASVEGAAPVPVPTEERPKQPAAPPATPKPPAAPAPPTSGPPTSGPPAPAPAPTKVLIVPAPSENPSK